MILGLHTVEPDERLTTVRFVLQLFDGFTGGSVLAGEISARLAGGPGGKRFGPTRKDPDATFVFHELTAGDYTIEARSNATAKPAIPPYYFGIEIPFTVPPIPPNGPPPVDPDDPPSWPGFPDITLADPDLPLDHPDQKPAYRVQRRRATLLPTASYPFPSSATLVRGTVSGPDGKPLQDATVMRRGRPHPTCTTGADGEFVIFLIDFPQPPIPPPNPPGSWKPEITLLVTHAAHPQKTKTIEVHRGMTVATNIKMTP